MPTVTGPNGAPVNGTETGNGHLKEPEKTPPMEELTDTLPPETNSEQQSGPRPTGNKAKPAPKISRTYKCDKCSFCSRKSRAFLYHLVEEHKSKMDIFACSQCDYCSQHKTKLQRHLRISHQINVEADDLKAEHAFTRTVKSPTVRPVKKVKSTFITKNIPGKKLTVKFVKPAASSTTLPAPKHLSYLPSPSKSQSMEHLSKVVEEIPSQGGAPVYKCKECQFTSDDKQKVAKHAVSWHVDTKSFSCTYCDYITFDRTDFMAHRQVHRNEHQFRCDECTYSTDFRPNMDRHIMNHKNSFPFTCSFCTYGCGSEAAIRRHMVMNHDPVPTEEKKAKLPVPAPKPTEKAKLPVPKPVESLQKSLQSDTEKQPAEKERITETSDHEAMESDTVDGNIDDMNEGLSTEQTGLQDLIQTKFKGTVTQYVEKDNGKLLCPVCKLKYKRSSDLNRHMKRKHGCRLREYVEKHFNVTFPPIESVRPPRSTQHVPLSMVNSRGEVGFSTEYLDYGNDDFIDMDDTFDSFSKPLQPEEPVTDSPLGGDKPLDLTFHQSQEDEQSIYPERLKCPHCLYQAKWPSDYRRHIAVHSVERKYKCSYCPKKYKYIGDLNVHARKDHNKEPGPVKVVKVPTLPKKKMSPALFKCPCCSYTSCWKSEVDRHSRLHKDEKTFQCKKCDYQSYWRGDMRRHMYKHHPELMTEGVAINDVIIVHKDRPKIVPGKVQDVKTAKSHTSLPNSQSLPYTEALSNIVTGSNMETVREEAEPQVILPLPKEIGPFAISSAEPQNLPLLSPIYQGLSPTKPPISFTGGNQEAPAVQAPPPASKSPTPSPIKDLGGGMYECNYCGFTANAPSKMNMHIATHTNLKRYKCTICGRRANWKWDISKHIKRDHNDFETQVIKLSKQEAEETIQEYMEGYPTVRRDHHLNVTPDRIIPHLDGVKFFKCSVCDFSAEKKLSVSRHISYMHSGVTARIVVIKKMPNDASPQITPTKKGTHITPSKVSPQITPSKISPQITPVKISPQITQSTPLENLDKGYTASPVVTPVLYEPLQTSGSQIPSTGSQLQTAGYQLPTTEDMDIDKPFMCSDCGKRGVTKGDVKKHYHYVHPNQEIRIVYLGDGSQSVYAAKSEIGQHTPEKNGASPAGITSGSELASSSETVSGSPANNSMDSSTNVSTGSSRSQSGTLPHPKVLGYIRPYKCSICGRRSNWKWDLNNHIRDKHRGEDVKVITLNENEAKATLDHYMNVELPVLLGTAIKGEGETVELPPPSKGTFRQLKCSSCSYRSNIKADVKRHIVRKHVGSRARIIVLDTETARRTLTGYDHDRFTSKQLIQDSTQTIQVPGSEYTMLNESVESQASPLLGTSADVVSGHETEKNKQLTVSGQLPKTAWDGLEKKYWKCSVCSYASEDKVEALKHMGKHNMKAYKCTGCDYNSNFRSGVYRHIKFKHGGDSTDVPVCKLTIKLIKEGPGLDSLGNQIMPEGVQEDAQGSPKQPSPSLPHQTPSPQKDVDSSVICEKYYCKKCMFQSKWRSCVCRHLRDKHKIIEYTENIMKRVIDVTGHSTSPQKVSNQAMMSPPTRMPPLITEPKKVFGGHKVEFSAKPRNFVCSICPYRTYKSKMLKFHNSCHKPQPGVKQVKCKYCPYYVSGARLLSQHMQLHIKHPEGPSIHPGTPEKASPQKVPSSPEVPKRHGCELCPYTTNSKNDFLYHKQFHRPKPTADFKCEHCEYWVTHKRLLKQHMKVHSGEESGSPNVSAVSTPTKSDYSENALIYDTVEIAAIKQKIIASKITPSISMTPMVSPMKLASNCTMGNKRGFMKKDGTYRKVHKCRFCPYMNLRLRNLRLHELMHGRRSATNTLMKCPHCNYYVGSKGLLAHHLKVHQPDYGMDFLPSIDDSSDKRSEASEDSEMEQPIPIQNKVDTLFEIARFKKYGCEKCPYASAKRAHFQRHVELHGSRQKCKCSFCDYSVPSMNLLSQHTKLHFEPNQNLLAAQSILNLQHLPEMPADVALSSMMANVVDSKHPVSVTHDHLELYENAPEDCEPKKIYRCDRCPYANIRRDHLLAHLRCHMTKNEYVCPYCDYSVGKTHVLMQHVKVHFSPLPELSDWLIQSGDTERIKQTKERDLKEAIELATLFQTERKKETKETEEKETDKSIKESESEAKESQNSDKTDQSMADTVLKADAKLESVTASEDKQDQAVSDHDNSKMETNEESFATVEVDHEISFKVSEKTVAKDSMDTEEKDKDIDSKTGETSNKKDGDSEKEDKTEDQTILKEGEKMDTSEDAAKDETKGEETYSI